jgi:hypothetical protein
MTAQLQGGQLQYTWSGKILPNDVGDPWLIGTQGKSFDLNVAVSQSAPDYFGGNVDFAAFDIDNAELSIDGQNIAFVGSGILDFTDNWTGAADLVTFHGDFDRFGKIIEFGSVVALPITTFQFQNLPETPPNFVSPANVVTNSGCCGATYGTFVAAGTPVRVIPEPSTLVLATILLFAGSGISTPRRW